MNDADFLLIDIGNTAAKLRLATRAGLRGKGRRVPTAELAAAGGDAVLRKALRGWRYRRVVFSSVVPAAARVVTAALPGALAVNATVDTGVDLRGYPGTKTLGADRIANAAGALVLYGPGPLIVVDFGTAATFNVLDPAGRFLGGIIAPGLAAATEYLPARTAQLPPVRLTGKFPKAIGRNTREALRAGALIGYRGMVREIVTALRAELGAAARVVATGGDARFLARSGTVEFDAVDPELTLQGLRVIAARQTMV